MGLAKSPPPALEAFALLYEKGIYRIKIFDHDLETIKALNSSILNAEATIGFSTDEMLSLANNTSLALEALRPLQPFDSIIKYIALASEPNESLPPSTLSGALPPALTNLNSALQTLGMRTKVTVPFTMSLLQPPASGSGSAGNVSSPPSLGTFSGAWNETIAQVLSVLHQNNAPFMMNIHPYPAYVNELKKKGGRKGKKGKSKGVSVAFALGTSNSSVVVDGGLEYRSLLDAMYDTVLAALAKAGYPNMPLIIGETGWPTAGAVEATVGNACRYLNQVIASASREEGTPRRPGQRIEMYVFEAFDESLKPAGTIEPNWGVMTEEGTEKYAVDWTNSGSVPICT